MIALATLLVGVSLGLPSFAQWATPGAACTQEGANANSNGFLTCTGGVWVSNAVLMGTTSATCDSTKAGYIRYTGGQFEGCNGTGWIQLASSSKLMVYTSDGTTVLGNYLGTLNALDVSSYVCSGILYADETTGVIKMLSSQECGEVSNGTVYFSGSNCTGTPYMRTSGGYGLCCTGLATCMTSKCKPVAGTESSHIYVSYRQSTGNCVSGSASISSVLTQPILCGESPCIVK